MNAQTIKKLQSIYGYTKVQNQINSGLVWKLEGYAGRYAMDLLKSGACLLPTVRRIDYYGSTVPSRYDVEPGTCGSYGNAIDFWTGVSEGNIDYIECLFYVTEE